MVQIFKPLFRFLDTLILAFLYSQLGQYILVKLKGYYALAEVFDLRQSLKKCGNPVHFQLPIWLTHPEHIEIGDEVSFAGFIHIWGGGGVKIGNRVMIGSHSAISSVTHDYSLDMMYGSVITKPIIIEDDVWISAHAVILPGVTIGKGAVVGAGCVVTKNVPPGAIVVGVPGRVLNFRQIEIAGELLHNHTDTKL